MIKLITGNVLKVEADCLVNAVNCEGYMGKGIIFQFKLAYPESLNAYTEACKKGNIQLGKIHHFEEKGKLIINFPIKNKWNHIPKISHIRNGLKELKKLIYEKQIRSIAIPALGCGNNELDWSEVKQILLSELKDCEKDVDIFICEPSAHLKRETTELPRLTLSHVLIVCFEPYLRVFSGRSIQKAAFFMTIFAGEEYFKFNQYQYGPYAPSVDLIMKNIKDYQNYHQVDSHQAFEIVRKNQISKYTVNKLEPYMPYVVQSANFVNSIKSDRVLELVASVCHIIQEKGVAERNDIISGIKNWPADKIYKQNSMDEIKTAISILLDHQIILQNLEGKYELVKKMQRAKEEAL